MLVETCTAHAGKIPHQLDIGRIEMLVLSKTK
jgi:hypothetical protein